MESDTHTAPWPSEDAETLHELCASAMSVELTTFASCWLVYAGLEMLRQRASLGSNLELKLSISSLIAQIRAACANKDPVFDRLLMNHEAILKEII